MSLTHSRSNARSFLAEKLVGVTVRVYGEGAAKMSLSEFIAGTAVDAMVTAAAVVVGGIASIAIIAAFIFPAILVWDLGKRFAPGTLGRRVLTILAGLIAAPPILLVTVPLLAPLVKMLFGAVFLLAVVAWQLWPLAAGLLFIGWILRLKRSD